MDFELNDQQTALRDATRACVEHDGDVREALRSLGAAGVIAAALHRSSAASDTIGYLMAVAQLASARPNWALGAAAHAEYCQALAIGSPDVFDAAACAKFINGEKIGCVGHDRVTAAFEGPKARLRGTTRAVPNAESADYLVVFADTPADRHAFVVKMDDPAVRLQAPQIAALAGSIRNVGVDGVLVDGSGRLATGVGAELFESVRDLRKLGIAATALGIARAALESTVSYVHGADRGAGPTSDKQSVQFLVSDMATELEAATLALWQAAALRDAGRVHRIESASAKVLATETAVRVTHAAARIRGVGGYTTGEEDHNAAALVLDILDATGEEELSSITTEMLKEP